MSETPNRWITNQLQQIAEEDPADWVMVGPDLSLTSYAMKQIENALWDAVEFGRAMGRKDALLEVLALRHTTDGFFDAVVTDDIVKLLEGELSR